MMSNVYSNKPRIKFASSLLDFEVSLVSSYAYERSMNIRFDTSFCNSLIEIGSLSGFSYLLITDSESFNL